MSAEDMHECPECGMYCDCDGEDHGQPAPDDCSHACDQQDVNEPIDDDYQDE